jgi:SAM-dependent methyltransferase
LYGFSWRNITGVDLYSEFPKVRVGRVEDLPFPKGVFDVVICSGVLGYVARREDAMRSIVSVVRPGGLVVLETNLTVRGPIAEYSLTGDVNIDDTIALVANRIQRSRIAKTFLARPGVPYFSSRRSSVEISRADDLPPENWTRGNESPPWKWSCPILGTKWNVSFAGHLTCPKATRANS